LANVTLFTVMSDRDTVNSDALLKLLPSLVHTISGKGWPNATQDRNAVVPPTTSLTPSGWIVMFAV